jgi:hypothetical protein
VLNRRDRRALARDVTKRHGLKGREKQLTSSSLARELLQMRATEGTLRDEGVPKVIARDETGTVVERTDSGLLAVKTNISRGTK